MGRERFEVLKKGVIKRKARRKIGLFIDGAGLDRATRRLDRKVDLSNLVKSLCSGIEPEVARYYTLVPYEDDARQFAFLDAVERAGLEVVVKRLPPKGVKRQVSMDVHIACDLVGYAYGHFAEKQAAEEAKTQANREVNQPSTSGTVPIIKEPKKPTSDEILRIATVVCPSREISYSLHLSNAIGVETCLADFGIYGNSDGWRGVDRWLDLSTSETIWR